jgi:hypothetical protein
MFRIIGAMAEFEQAPIQEPSRKIGDHELAKAIVDKAHRGRFGRSDLTIDISLRPRSSLRRWPRAREDRLRGGDRVGLLGLGAAELWLQRCSRRTPGSSEIGKKER